MTQIYFSKRKFVNTEVNKADRVSALIELPGYLEADIKPAIVTI